MAGFLVFLTKNIFNINFLHSRDAIATPHLCQSLKKSTKLAHPTVFIVYCMWNFFNTFTLHFEEFFTANLYSAVQHAAKCAHTFSFLFLASGGGLPLCPPRFYSILSDSACPQSFSL